MSDLRDLSRTELLEIAELATSELEQLRSRLAAAEAETQRLRQAAQRVLTDGHTESPYYMDLRDHDETLAALAAALRQEPGR